MNIICVICSDLFLPHAEVYVTQCGHMFHLHCLMHWLDRSKTCPQCRNKATEKTIHRLYFNLGNTDGIKDDPAILQSRIESLQFQLSTKEGKIKSYKARHADMKSQNDGLREELKKVENDNRVHQSATCALKDQISYFKMRAKETDRVAEELHKAKARIKDMENVHLVINGTREDVNNILRYETNIEALALMAATLKKSLLDAEARKRDLDRNLKKAQNEVAHYKRDCNKLECQNAELNTQLQNLKVSYDQEKEYLRNKIAELNKKISSRDSLDITNTSLKRIIDESPVNYSRKQVLSLQEDIEEPKHQQTVASPSLEQKVQNILDSDSPYLPVKSSNVGINIFNTKFKPKTGTARNGFSIFKPPPSKLESISVKRHSEVMYDGFGGSSKEDVYPSPKPKPTGLKRKPKSSSDISASKFRKLAPGPIKES